MANPDSSAQYSSAPIPLAELAVQLKLAQKIHGRWRSKKYLRDLYEVLALGSKFIKVGMETSTIREPLVTVRNSDIAEFGAQLEQKTPLKAYADRRGPRTSKKICKGRDPKSCEKIYRLNQGQQEGET